MKFDDLLIAGEVDFYGEHRQAGHGPGTGAGVPGGSGGGNAMNLQERFDAVSAAIFGEKQALILVMLHKGHPWETEEPKGRWMVSRGRYSTNRYTALEAEVLLEGQGSGEDYKIKNDGQWGIGETPEGALEDLIRKQIAAQRNSAEYHRRHLAEETAKLEAIIAAAQP
jgi:predicted NUDIX family NTP pyrophosphohydrolase